LDIGVLGYIGIVWPKEHSPEVWSFPPVTPCIYTHTYFFIFISIKTCKSFKKQQTVKKLGISTKLKNPTGWKFCGSGNEDMSREKQTYG